jgi:palmitoyltransferase ZDHHC13/17
MQAGGLPLLVVPDKMGNTPAECARNGNHMILGHHLQHEERRLSSKAASKNSIMSTIMGLHFAPVIWIACLATITVLFLKVLGNSVSGIRPKSWMIISALILVVSFGMGLVLMAAVNVSDPGYVPRRGERPKSKTKEYTSLIDTDNLDCPALWAGNWEQLCVTCKIVRPLRSKHDPVCNRCIEVCVPCCTSMPPKVMLQELYHFRIRQLSEVNLQVFDHFCPWVGNAIGKGNRHLFIVFIVFMLISLVLGYAIAVGRLAQTGFFEWGPRHRQSATSAAASSTMTWALAWLICNIPLLLPVVGLAGAQVTQVTFATR